MSSTLPGLHAQDLLPTPENAVCFVMNASLQAPTLNSSTKEKWSCYQNSNHFNSIVCYLYCIVLSVKRIETARQKDGYNDGSTTWH